MIERNEVNLKMLGNFIVSNAELEVSSVRDRNGIPDGVVGDINQDGKIDVADLGLVAYYYAAQEGDANWDKAQIADITKDGKVDIGDLHW